MLFALIYLISEGAQSRNKALPACYSYAARQQKQQIWESQLRGLGEGNQKTVNAGTD